MALGHANSLTLAQSKLPSPFIRLYLNEIIMDEHLKAAHYAHFPTDPDIKVLYKEKVSLAMTFSTHARQVMYFRISG